MITCAPLPWVNVTSLRSAGGTVTVGGLLWSQVRGRDPLRRSVQMIFQDPYASLNPRMTACETIAEVLHVWNSLSWGESKREAVKRLQEVGLAGQVINRRPGQLSGGQCQRIGIARALACDPSILIADEPTSSLDVSVQAQILNLLQDLRAARGLALVLVSHDLSVVRCVTNRALVMYRSRVIEEGPTDQLFVSPRHPYTRVLVDSIPGSTKPALLVTNPVDLFLGCVFASRCPRIGQGQ